MTLSRVPTAQLTGALSFCNRIINGDMRIDQRNAGAAVTPTGASQYTIDRFIGVNTQSAKLTYQQVVDAPIGFVNSFKILVASAATPTAGDQFRFGQSIEGFNTADFGWGTANAQAATISFRAKASIAGIYSVALWNGANGRSYVTTVSLTTAWATYSFTVPGDTTGTWGTGNGAGIELIFDLGGGSNWVAPSNNAWQAGNYFKASGSVSLVSNAAATLNVTGVQLEAGTVATPFERRDYGRELMMCQRYFEKSFPQSIAPNNNGTGVGQIMFALSWGGSQASKAPIRFAVVKRSVPTLTKYGDASANYAFLSNGNLPTTQQTYNYNSNINPEPITDAEFCLSNQATQSTLFCIYGGWTASAEL